MIMSEYYPGETEDIWENEVALNGLLREQKRLEAILEHARTRKETTKNPATWLLSTMSISARTRRLERVNGAVEWVSGNLPLPDYSEDYSDY
jgi:hypothetical protein